MFSLTILSLHVWKTQNVSKTQTKADLLPVPFQSEVGMNALIPIADTTKPVI
jgi:hypothetical protein